jgi:hypothetical protein
MGMGGGALVPARPEPMVVGGGVLGEDGRGRALTGPIPVTEEETLTPFIPVLMNDLRFPVMREC